MCMCAHLIAHFHSLHHYSHTQHVTPIYFLYDQYKHSELFHIPCLILLWEPVLSQTVAHTVTQLQLHTYTQPKPVTYALYIVCEWGWEIKTIYCMSTIQCLHPSVHVGSMVPITGFCSRPKTDICSAVSVNCMIICLLFCRWRKRTINLTLKLPHRREISCLPQRKSLQWFLVKWRKQQKHIWERR